MTATDDWVRREVLLALGKGNQQYWLRAKKNQVEQMTPWEKRGFLYAASCMPRGEVKHWYAAISPRLNPLESYVVQWAKASPISP
jgi:hypothetical protein